MEFGVIIQTHSISRSLRHCLRYSHLDKQKHSDDLLLLLLLLSNKHRSTGGSSLPLAVSLSALYLSMLRSAVVSQVTQPENDIIPVSTHTCFLNKHHPSTPPRTAPVHFLDFLKRKSHCSRGH